MEWPRSKPIVLSFDLEEHNRIEAAVGTDVGPELEQVYHERMRSATYSLLEVLARRDIKATFFIVGEIARSSPDLVRAIHSQGHEVACHGWRHRRLIGMSPEEFRRDTRKAKEALEDTIGTTVVGFRAPTFSIIRETAWALDILVEEGFTYDSSIYPVRHDRYGVPNAPRGPFLARGKVRQLVELPLATLQIGSLNLPVGGGGYFRLFPLWFLKYAIGRWQANPAHGPTALYFHPWEFDPDQPRLPLRKLNRFRTYVGLRHNRERFESLLERFPFSRAVDVARDLLGGHFPLPCFDLGADALVPPLLLTPETCGPVTRAACAEPILPIGVPAELNRAPGIVTG